MAATRAVRQRGGPLSAGDRARAKELFLEVCDLPPQEQAAALGAACGENEELLRRVEELLAFDSASEAFEKVPGAVSETPAVRGFKVLRKLGEGGMGEVWEAEQQRPVRRVVALKLIRGGLGSKEVLARFETERQALALMSHPNIAQVYGAGTADDGRPFFTMEYVKGVPITEYCDVIRLSPGERLELFIQVCDGVRHAHQKGIIHRDLKPSNVLVQAQERAVPKIIDFGVAKATAQRLTERSLLTRFGQWIGTPEYMSPEQAELTGLDVDTRSDVYSLGILLYELLVGSPPLDPRALRSAGVDEMRRLIREQDPPRPSVRVTTMGEDSRLAAERRRTDPGRLARLLRGDLDWIVMKALEKDRTRRYASVSELAADVGRHLRTEPVLARPPSTLYRMRKLVHRHRLAFSAAILVVLAVVAGVAGTTHGLIRARREAAVSSRAFDFLTGVFSDIDPEATGKHTTSVVQVLDRGSERLRHEFTDQPLVRARLMTTMGQAYQGLGEYGKSRPLLEEALTIRRRELGDRHPDVAAALTTLGRLLVLDGRFREARPLFEESLQTRELLDGPASASVGVGLNDLSHLLWKLGELERSRQLCERSVEILERAEDADDLVLAQALSNLQTVLRELNETDAALVPARRALELREQHLGPDHTSVGWALHDLAVLYRIKRDNDTARGLAERSLAIQEAALGADHFAVSFPLSQLALLDARAGDRVKAITGFERALAIREQALGHDHPDLVWVLRPLGTLLAEHGELETGRRMLERAVELSERTYGPRHSQLASSLTALAVVLHAEGDLERSRQLNQRSLEIVADIFGPRDYRLGTNLVNLACLAVDADDLATALRHLREATSYGFADPAVIEDGCFDPLRGDPEYESIAAEVTRLLDQRRTSP